MTFSSLAAALGPVCADVFDARAEAADIVSALTGFSEASILARGRVPLPPEIAEEAERILKRRLAREPLAYILGRRDFYGVTIKAREGVLIPRQETEYLADALVRVLPQGGRFADVCCGSGAIACAVLAARPDATAAAFDVSPDALALTRENAAALGVTDRLEVAAADIRDADALGAYTEGFDAAACNPPYIRTAELESLQPEVRREPALALDGGTDGLDLVRCAFLRLMSIVKPGGFAVVETGADTAGGALSYAAALGGRTGRFAASLHPDFSGVLRYIELRFG